MRYSGRGEVTQLKGTEMVGRTDIRMASVLCRGGAEDNKRKCLIEGGVTD